MGGTILVLCDSAASAPAALDRAIEEARAGRGSLTVLAVMETPPRAAPLPGAVLGGATPDVFSPDGVIHAPLEVAPALASARERVEAAGLTAEYAWTVGEPGRAVVEVADSLNATLIVVGEHHHGLLGSLLWADVGDEVGKHARCEVVVVRP